MTNIVYTKRNRTTANPPSINPLNPDYVSADQVAYVYTTDTLYYGIGDPSDLPNNTALSLKAIGGSGAFVDKSTPQTINGVKTFGSTIVGSINGNAGTATKWLAPMTLNASGDIAGSVSFDGSSTPSSLSLTLPTVNSNLGTYTKITLNGKGLATAGAQASLSDLSSPTANYDFGGFQVTNAADPTTAQALATKNYVDITAQGFKIKPAFLAATTNIALTGLFPVDGVTPSAGDIILAPLQTNPVENGVYVAAAGAWSRAPNADTWDKLVSAYAIVAAGATLQDTSWLCTVDPGGTLGVTPVTWIRFGGVGTYTGGNGIDVSALNVISAKTDNVTITTSAGNLTLTGNAAAIAGVTFANNTLLVATGTNTFAALPISAYMQSLLASATDSAARTALGLGTIATQDANNVAITGGSITNLTTFDGITISQGNFN